MTIKTGDTVKIISDNKPYLSVLDFVVERVYPPLSDCTFRTGDGRPNITIKEVELTRLVKV